MARLRFMAVALLALALAGNSAQTGRTQTSRDYSTPAVGGASVWSAPSSAASSQKSAATDDRSCVIYSLTDMGYDGDLGTWIAKTIPEMVEPSSWRESGGRGVLRYYAPKNILIVNHSAAVRSKVDDFLKKLKTSMPETSHTKFAANKKSSRPHVVPAEYRAPAPMRTANPIPEASSYPVPAQVKPPKHLFHFIIRYEGEGIIDDNVVKFMKGYVKATKDGESQVPVQATARGYAVPASPPMPSYSCPAGAVMNSLSGPTTLPSTVAVSPAVGQTAGMPATTSGPLPSAVAVSPAVGQPIGQPTIAQPKQPEPKKSKQKEKTKKEE